MTYLDTLTDLESKAKAATPGPWRWDYGNWEVESRNESAFRHAICSMTPDDRECAPFHESGFNPIDPMVDAEFIAAANPAVILDLCTKLRKCVEVLEFYAEFESESGFNSFVSTSVDVGYEGKGEARAALKEIVV